MTLGLSSLALAIFPLVRPFFAFDPRNPVAPAVGLIYLGGATVVMLLGLLLLAFGAILLAIGGLGLAWAIRAYSSPSQAGPSASDPDR